MAAALIVSLGLQWSGTFEMATPLGFAQTMLTTVGIATAVWLTATFVTAPEPDDKLMAFYRRVHPAGPGWSDVARRSGLPPAAAAERLAPSFVNWVLGIAVVYSTLFALGQMLFGSWSAGFALAGVALVAGVLLSRRLE